MPVVGPLRLGCRHQLTVGIGRFSAGLHTHGAWLRWGGRVLKATWMPNDLFSERMYPEATLFSLPFGGRVRYVVDGLDAG